MAQRLLSARLALGNVDDVEGLCRSILRSSRLTGQDFDDALAHLIGECWRLSLEYDPTRDARRSFAGWAGQRLRQWLVDYQRARLGRSRWKFAGRTYERPRPQILSLDADEGGRDQLERTLPPRSGDLAPGGDLAFGGLDLDRDRLRTRDLYTLGLDPPGRAA